MHLNRKKRNVKITAVALCLCMLWGVLTVQAKSYALNEISKGMVLLGGDVIAIGSNNMTICYNMLSMSAEHDASGVIFDTADGASEMTIRSGAWKVTDYNSHDYVMCLMPVEKGGGGSEEHYYSSWTVVTPSTLKNPGTMQGICIDHGDTSPVKELDFSTLMKDMEKQIKAAPENATLTFANPAYNALSKEVMEALRERGDVTFVFQFMYEDEEIQIRIPAGQADANGHEYYGPKFLKGTYGV